MSDITKKAVFNNLGMVGGNAKSLKPSVIDHSDISAKRLPARPLGAPQNNRFLDQTALLNNKANGNLNKAATSFDVSPYAHSPYVNNLGFDRDVYSSTPIASGDVSTKRAAFLDELSSKVMNTDAPPAPAAPPAPPAPAAPAAPAPVPSPAPSPTPEPVPELKAPAPVAPAPTVGNTGSIYDTQKGYDQRAGAHAPDPLLAPAKTFAQEALKPGADFQGLVNKYYVEPQVSKIDYSALDPEKVQAFKKWHQSLPNTKNLADYEKTINDAGAMYDPSHPDYNKIREPYYKKTTPSLAPGYNYMTAPYKGHSFYPTAEEKAEAALVKSRSIRPEILDYLHGVGLIQKGNLSPKDFSSGFGQSRGVDAPASGFSAPDSDDYKRGRYFAQIQRLQGISKELQGLPEDIRVKAIDSMPLSLSENLLQVNGDLTPSVNQSRTGLMNKTIGELGTMDSPGASSQSVFHFLADPKSTVSIEDRIKTLPPDKQALVKNLPANQRNLIRHFADKYQNQSTIEDAKRIAGDDGKIPGVTSGNQKHSPGYWFDGKLGELEEKYGVGAWQPTKGILDNIRAFSPFGTDTVYNDVNAQKLIDENTKSIDYAKSTKALLNTLNRINNPNDSYAAGFTPEQRLSKINEIKRELSKNTALDATSMKHISDLDSITANPIQEAIQKGNIGEATLGTLGNAFNLHPAFNLFNTLARMGVYGLEGKGPITHDNKDIFANALGMAGGIGSSIKNVIKGKGFWPKFNNALLPAGMSIDPIDQTMKFFAKPTQKANDPDYLDQQIRQAKNLPQVNEIIARAEKENLLDKDKADTFAAPAVQEVKNPGVTSGMTSLQKALLAAGIGIPAVMAITAALGAKKTTKPIEDDDEEDDEEDEIAYKRKLRARNANR